MPPDRLQEANALRGLAFSFSAILGPATAGVIVAATSAGWALVFDAATFAVSAVSLALMRLGAVPKRAAASVRRQLGEGFELVRSRRWLWVSIVYWGIFNLTALPAFLVLGPYVAKHTLGGATAWAVILAVAFFFASVAIAYGNTLWTTTLQARVPPQAISRATSFDLLGTYVVSPLGYALVGALAAGIGVTATLGLAAGLGAAAAVVTLAVLPGGG